MVSAALTTGANVHLRAKHLGCNEGASFRNGGETPILNTDSVFFHRLQDWRVQKSEAETSKEKTFLQLESEASYLDLKKLCWLTSGGGNCLAGPRAVEGWTETCQEFRACLSGVPGPRVGAVYRPTIRTQVQTHCSELTVSWTRVVCNLQAWWV